MIPNTKAMIASQQMPRAIVSRLPEAVGSMLLANIHPFKGRD
jgi:hypothetical protein